MSFPPLHPPRDTSASSDSRSATLGSTRPRQSAWGLSASQLQSRRDLTPLDTNFSAPSDANGRRSETLTNPSASNNLGSPFAAPLSSTANPLSRLTGRNTPSISSSTSPFAPFQSGSQQLPSSQLLSPRSRTNTPFPAATSASSAAASTTASQGGGGGGSSGGGQSRPATFSPSVSTHAVSSPTASAFDRNLFASATPTSAGSSQSSVSKIVITQVFLLLGSITEKEGKAKWESQADAIRKLVSSHGMEVFPSYFRRLLVGNSPQIFPGKSRNVENPSNYPLLVEEIGKASQSFEQAKQVAEVVDSSDGDVFKDFDLQALLAHFKLDPVGKTIIASAFAQVGKSDLRAKALSILASTFPSLLQTFANINNSDLDIPPLVLATAALRALLDLPESARDGTEKSQINLALTTRYSKQNQPLPQVIRSAMAIPELLVAQSGLAKELMKRGPLALTNIESAKDLLRRFGRVNLNDEEIAITIIFIVLNPYIDNDRCRLDVFVEAVRDQCSNIVNWNNVVRAFDKEAFLIDQQQLLTLYQALLPIAKEDNDFDIQLLWGGQRQHAASQLSFAISFASLLSGQLDATTIPRLRIAFDPQDASDGPEEVQELAEQARHDPMISLDAVTAIIEALWSAGAQLSQQDMFNARTAIGEKMALFACSASGIPQPWTPSHSQFLIRTVNQCLLKSQDNYSFILHILWKQDKNWLHNLLVQFHSDDPIKLPLLLEHAREHGWLKELCTTVTGFGIDLAALAHKESLLDLQAWADEKLKRNAVEFTTALNKFLVIKTQDEMRTQRMEQPAPRTVSLAMKTVHAMLEILEEYGDDKRDELNVLERHCMQAFPRLCNYGEGFDHVIEERGAESNALPPSADAAMQDRYKRMYSGEVEVRQVIEDLRDCKTSEDGEKQDLFACMIHGLFDEYVCFNEYPLGPLAKTAVLFGGIINYRLISNISLNVALEMVLESVRDYSPDSPMYKFGLQALIHFLGRLPEWLDYCQRLVQVHGLQGTDAYARAQEVARERSTNGAAETAGLDDLLDASTLTNGNSGDFFESDSLVPQFRSINVDTVSQLESFEDPEEDVQDKVLFVLNNVSSENLSTKINDLVDALEPKHFQWFASYIVEQRAKSQPNYQSLYLDLLGLLDSKSLWADVLRETYVSLRKIMNAESTMKLPSERTYLKNLGTWLGSLTIARDKPIKHKNIAFKELLIEGWETQRLLLVIPFTCEVLAQGVNSIIFKPPNPWIMEIVGLLLELYDLAELKIQQRFAIEILLGAFGLPRKGEGMERGTDLKKRQQMFTSQIPDPMIPDGLEGFNDMGLNSLGKGLRNSRFTPPALPDLENLLTLPPSISGPISQAQLRRLVQSAVKRSIEEIIGPVVERSITIATISTKDLIQKDFAQEPDEEKIRAAFEQMVKSLASSLASVTCKEPLRMSMNQYIRQMAAEIPDQPVPEGSILMCVNDNLDMACRIVEKQAEDRALVEIETAIEAETNKRRQHKIDFPNEPYRDANTSQWATFIPEPYKQISGGLNQQQLDIYQNFAPQARGAISHLPNASTDSGKQIPDVLQEVGFPAVPNLSTPAEPPALPHQAQQQPQGRLLPPSMDSTRPPSQVNGYLDGPSLWEHIQESLTELIRETRDTSEQRLRNLARETPIQETAARIVSLVRSAPQDMDQVAYQTANAACSALFADGAMILEAEVLVHIVKAMCALSESYTGKLRYMLREQAQAITEGRFLHVSATAALLETGFLDYIEIDTMMADALHQRNMAALQCFSQLLDILVFDEMPATTHAFFGRSFGILGEWIANSEDLELGKTIMEKLKTVDSLEILKSELIDPNQIKESELHYVYEEWLAYYSQAEGSETTLLPFVNQLLKTMDFSSSPDAIVRFLRFAVQTAAGDFARIITASPTDSELHLEINAVATLIVLVIKFQDADKKSKTSFMKMLLIMSAMIFHNEQWQQPEVPIQRAFVRFFSTIFLGWHEYARGDLDQDKEMVLAFGEVLLILQPHNFPIFCFGWMSLLTHQTFLPAVLKTAGKEGSDIYASLMEIVCSYACKLVKPVKVDNFVKYLYRGVLRLLLILHHDFPEFLADYHFRLCNRIPSDCMQLRNLVLSAYPSSILELPDPFSDGLKVDRLEDVKREPNVVTDTAYPLRKFGIKDILDNALQTTKVQDDIVQQILEMLPSPEDFVEPAHSALFHSMVLYIGQRAVSNIASLTTDGPPFTTDGPHCTLICRLAEGLSASPRYHFLGAIVNQLRYPNSHTWFFSSTLLHLFGFSQHPGISQLREQITRVLLERLVIHRPHPWGLIIVLLELLKNRNHLFWEQPQVKSNPEIQKLFDVLFAHVNRHDARDLDIIDIRGRM